MEESKRFQGSRVDESSRRRLIENQDTINELTARIQELQRMIRDILKMLNQYAVDYPTCPVNQRYSHFFRDPGGMLSRSVGMLSRNDKPPDIRDTHGISGNVFVNPPASSSTPYPQESNPCVSNVSEHISPHVMSESQTPAQDQRCQSGSSARNSFVPTEGDSSKNYGADKQRLQISDLHFDKCPNPATFACWKIRFNTEVCSCSQFLTEAMQWIKRSGDGWISGWSQIFAFYHRNSRARLGGTRCENCFSTEQSHPEFPLQEKGQSGGNESLKRRSFPSWKTDRLLNLWVLPGNWSQWFCRELCGPICSCSSKWNSIRNGTEFYYQ